MLKQSSIDSARAKARGSCHFRNMFRRAGGKRPVPLNPRIYTVALAGKATVTTRTFGNVRTAAGAAMDPNGTLVVTGSDKADQIDIQLNISSNPPDPTRDTVTAALNGS